MQEIGSGNPWMPAQYPNPRSSDSAIILASALRSAASSAAVSPVTLLRYRRTARLVLLTAWAAGAALLVSVTLGTILRPQPPRSDVRAASPGCRNRPADSDWRLPYWPETRARQPAIHHWQDRCRPRYRRRLRTSGISFLLPQPVEPARRGQELPGAQVKAEAVVKFCTRRFRGNVMDVANYLIVAGTQLGNFGLWREFRDRLADEGVGESLAGRGVLLRARVIAEFGR